MSNFNESIDLDKGISTEDMFKLLDILSIEDASAMIAGVSPDCVQRNWNGDEEYVCLNINSNHPQNANAVFSLCMSTLKNAVRLGKIKADICILIGSIQLTKRNLQSDWLAEHEIDTKRTTIDREDLKEWLEHRDVYPSTLFPINPKTSYMNRKHPNYSPELAACIASWTEAQTASMNGQTIKQYLEQWLRDNAHDYGVKNAKDSKKFAELASIPNWDTTGGKAKIIPTPPIENKKPSSINQVDMATVRRKVEADLPAGVPVDDDIPF